MAELTSKELAQYEMADVVGHFLLNTADKATRATLAHLLQENLGGELSAWLKVIDETADDKFVLVTCSGGVVDVDTIPPGVVVEVWDYDGIADMSKDDLHPDGTVKDPEHPNYGWEYGIDDQGSVYQKAVYDGRCQ